MFLIFGSDLSKMDQTQARLWACGRGDMSTPSFGSHLNPISTGGGRFCPPYTGVHTKFWKPQARLMSYSQFCVSVQFKIPKELLKNSKKILTHTYRSKSFSNLFWVKIHDLKTISSNIKMWFCNDFVHIVARQVDNNRAVLGKVW